MGYHAFNSPPEEACFNRSPTSLRAVRFLSAHEGCTHYPFFLPTPAYSRRLQRCFWQGSKMPARNTSIGRRSVFATQPRHLNRYTSGLPKSEYLGVHQGLSWRVSTVGRQQYESVWGWGTGKTAIRRRYDKQQGAIHRGGIMTRRKNNNHGAVSCCLQYSTSCPVFWCSGGARSPEWPSVKVIVKKGNSQPHQYRCDSLHRDACSYAFSGYYDGSAFNMAIISS